MFLFLFLSSQWGEVGAKSHVGHQSLDSLYSAQSSQCEHRIQHIRKYTPALSDTLTDIGAILTLIVPPVPVCLDGPSPCSDIR